MPLKHDVETLMVFILGLMIALAGAVVAFLPPVSVSVIPWASAFVVSLLYPLALYPMMKERRADHAFRALHFAPALILLAWLALDLLAAFKPEWDAPQSLYTRGWASAGVIAALALLGLFCWSVMRRRGVRMGLLASVLVPFLLLSQWSDMSDWDGRLAQLMWNEGPTDTAGGILAGGGTSSNLSPSSDDFEEQWRAQLRRMERRSRRLEASAGSATSVAVPVSGARTGTVIAAGGLSEEDVIKGDPPHLPSSGFGMEAMAPIVLAGYCAAVQRKTQKRARA